MKINTPKQILRNGSKQYIPHQKGNLLYYGLLGYTIIFFSQIAGRFPILAPFRIELIIGCVLLISIFSKIIQGDIKLSENNINAAAIIFFVVVFLSIPFAYVKSTALTAFIRVFKFFAIYLMIIAAIDNKRKLKGFIFVFLLMNSIIILEPFILSIQGKGFIWNNHMWRLKGPTSLFGHPNALGMLASSMLPFYYYFINHVNSKLVKILCLSLIIIALRVIMLTQSRTAFVGVLAFAFFVWLFSNKKLIGLLVGILVFSIIWQFTPQQTKDRFLTLTKSQMVMTTDRDDFTHDERIALGSMNSRFELMRRSLIAFIENPVIGIGLDCFASFNGNRWGLWFPPHNTYFQVLAELGLLGFLALSFVIYFTLKNIKQAKNLIHNLKSQDSFISTTLSALTMYYSVNLVVSFFGIELDNNFWWVAGGLSLVILRVIKIEHETNHVKVIEE